VFAGREGVDKLIHTVLRPTLDDFVAFQVGVDTTDLLVIDFYIDCAHDFFDISVRVTAGHDFYCMRREAPGILCNLLIFKTGAGACPPSPSVMPVP